MGNSIITNAIKPQSDSTTAIKIENASGASPVVTFDTTNLLMILANALNFTGNGSIILSGNNALTLTTTGPTNVTLPTSGTLLSSATNPNSVVNFRLSLTTGVPVTTADVLAATTIYVTPYKGNQIALFDGVSTWNVLASVEMSIAVPATTVTMYDVFCYNNAGTPTLELLAWTNDTTRATALVLQNGVLVKSGATTRRYLGSFRTTGVSGQTEDSQVNRFIYNYYNQKNRPMLNGFTSNHQSASGTYVDIDTGIHCNFIIGYADTDVAFGATGTVGAVLNGIAPAVSTAIAYDGTTPEDNVSSTNSPDANGGAALGIAPANRNNLVVGLHYVTLIGKMITVVADAIWYGAAALSDPRCTLHGRVKG